MFSKLQEDANKIDIETQRLYAQIPSVMNSYTYNNKPSIEIFVQKECLFNEIKTACKSFLLQQHEMQQLLNSCEQDVNEMQEYLEKTLTKLNISITYDFESSINSADADVDTSIEIDIETDKSDTNIDDDIKMTIARSQFELNPNLLPDTPAFKNKQPTQKRIAQLKQLHY